MIDDCRNFRVWIDLNELGTILIPLPNFDEMIFLRQVRLFEHDIDFLYVRAGQCVEIDHNSRHMVLLCRRRDLGS